MITSWEGVTLNKYFEIKETLDDRKLTDLDRDLRLVAILCNVPLEALSPIPVTNLKTLFNKLKFLQEEPKAEIKDLYEIDGKVYRLVKRVDDITAGQFIDLSNYTRDPNLVIDNIHLIVATLLLPTKLLKVGHRLSNNLITFAQSKPGGRKYLRKRKINHHLPDMVPYDGTRAYELAEVILEGMPVTDAMGIAAFFYQLFAAFSQTILLYLGSEANQKSWSALGTLMEMKEMQQIPPGLRAMLVTAAGSIQNGAGFQQSMVSAMEIAQSGSSSSK